MDRRYQSGLTTVEFAIVGAVVLTLIFAVLEVARAYYVYTMLNDGTRRGARVAAVCPINDPAIALATVFDVGDGSGSAYIPGLTTANVQVEYLDGNNNVIANPGDAAGFAQIRFVRVSVNGFQHQAIIPMVGGPISFFMPAFVTILPRESLGIPREGVVTPC
jgi:Flp pilus assembly protein TadG